MRILLSLDEARAAVVASSARLLRWAEGPPASLERMLWGLDPGAQAGVGDHLLAIEHAAVLEAVRAAGHDWVVPEQLEGIVAAAGLAQGQRRWAEVAACVSDLEGPW